MNRRSFLKGILAAGVAPYVVTSSGLLMPVREIWSAPSGHLLRYRAGIFEKGQLDIEVRCGYVSELAPGTLITAVRHEGPVEYRSFTYELSRAEADKIQAIGYEDLYMRAVASPNESVVLKMPGIKKGSP